MFDLHYLDRIPMFIYKESNEQNIETLESISDNNVSKKIDNPEPTTILSKNEEKYFNYNLYSNGYGTITNSSGEFITNSSLPKDNAIFKIRKHPCSSIEDESKYSWYIYTNENLFIDTSNGMIINDEDIAKQLIINSSLSNNQSHDNQPQDLTGTYVISPLDIIDIID